MFNLNIFKAAKEEKDVYKTLLTLRTTIEIHLNLTLRLLNINNQRQMLFAFCINSERHSIVMKERKKKNIT